MSLLAAAWWRPWCRYGTNPAFAGRLPVAGLYSPVSPVSPVSPAEPAEWSTLDVPEDQMTSDDPKTKPDRVRIENVNHPGKSTPVDGAMYRAMRDALLDVLPAKSPGMTETQMRSAVLPKLPPDLFPGGARAGWWSKAVQLDLEAKGEVTRELARPLRWHRPTQPTRPSEVRTSRDGGSPPPRHGGDKTP